MKIENKIRAVARSRNVVKISRRARSKTGFVVTDPWGIRQTFPNKKTALQNLLARIRCTEHWFWKLEVKQ